MTPARRRKLRRALCRISGTSGIPVATLKSWDAPIHVIQMEVLSRKLVRLCQKHHIQIEMPTPAIRAALTRDFPALDPLIIDYLSLLR